jgi:hypothetical protein
LTDKLKVAKRIEKAFVYISGLTKECRKFLTTKFEREYKGLPFDSIEPILRKEVDSWFNIRDGNIEVHHDQSVIGQRGELFITYLGSTKEMYFKIHINSVFTVAGSSSKSPSYLKSLNLSVNKKDFDKK